MEQKWTVPDVPSRSFHYLTLILTPKKVIPTYSATDLALAGFNYLGTPYETMDCQKFVEKCMSDVGLKMDLTGSNAWYRAMTWTGTPEECKARFGRIPPGALLFILEPVSSDTPEKYRRDGIGDATHMGIRTGQGKGAIHSSQSRGGVCESDFRDKTIPNGGWNRVGLYDKFTYEGLPANWADQGDVPPSTSTATVVAASGKTVNLRKAKSTGSKLVERVPVGATVRILRSGETWSRVAYTDPSGAVWCGWMVNAFLRTEQGDGLFCSTDVDHKTTVPDVPACISTPLYAVTIPFLTEDQARALLGRYSGAWMTKEKL